ncbi:hypothetical protein SynRS9909_01162 [Synechococcus sp. RS9909]|nr:hypothetical protein SynRS9909_01162 [Synechococcus sp. RS9909]
MCSFRAWACGLLGAKECPRIERIRRAQTTPDQLRQKGIQRKERI